QLVARLALLRVDEAPDHADRLARGEEHLADAAACEEARPGLERARHVGDVHGLLGILRAAEGAHPGAEAAALVPGNPRPRVADRRGSALEEAAVPAVDPVRHRAHAELVLHVLEVGAEVRLAGPDDAVPLGPLVEHVLGGAVAGAGVDGG